MIGGFITWWHNFGLKKEIRDLKKDSKDIKDLLHMVGEIYEEQQKIIDLLMEGKSKNEQ